VRRDAPPPPPPDEQALSTFHVDKTRHFYSPTRHDCQQKKSWYSSCMCPPAMLGKLGSSELKETADTRDGSESHSGG
jgi:hypothetical protein